MAKAPPTVDELGRILEQYKSLVSDVGNVGTRYATANGFYLSVLTAVLGVLAYVGTGKPFDQTSYPLILMVALFAIAVCWIWNRTIAFYGSLFRAKFTVLKMLEQHLPVKVYTEEKAILDQAGTKALSRNEAWVPIALGVFYGVIAAIALAKIS